jgi:dGTPase
MNSLEIIRKDLDNREAKTLSSLGTFSLNAIRRKDENRIESGYRQAFSLDVDRILHSLAYTRYIDKTQVFYLVKNDHITHRVLHVQLVSKIARTIGRFLGLNEDLIEAIALGHDIGHTPFGHVGERFMSKICRSYDIGHFRHNVQSVHFLDRVENKGLGCNLCLQTLDGILCHDGEIHNRTLKPEKDKSFETHQKEIYEKKMDPGAKLVPMTMEGCVVRFSDTISYVGRDIEDAIRLGLIKRSDLPARCVDMLGDTNGTIVYNLVTDIIENSYHSKHITFSPEISEVLRDLKQFNYEYIYLTPEIKRHSKTIESLFDTLFDRYMNDIKSKKRSSVIFTSYLENMSEDYLENLCGAEIVRDFIAGMTDQYFLKQCPRDMRPK